MDPLRQGFQRCVSKAANTAQLENPGPHRLFPYSVLLHFPAALSDLSLLRLFSSILRCLALPIQILLKKKCSSIPDLFGGIRIDTLNLQRTATLLRSDRSVRILRSTLTVKHFADGDWDSKFHSAFKPLVSAYEYAGV
jgi:hypothetical protein